LPGQEREYRDWRKGGHGYVDLREALAQSVNTYFYGVAVDLGIDRLSGYLARFGFGAPTGIDIGGDAPGVLPSREWKRTSRKQVWYPGETVISGIGQGFWVTTPLQLAQATALLAAGGRGFRPRMLRAAQRGFDADVVREPPGQPMGIPVADPRHLRAVTEGMVAVMHSPTGSARAAAVDVSYLIAGKTGTAQRVGRTGDEAVDLDSLPFHLRNRALFVAFAPADDPRIAVAVVVESGGSGSRAAAPVARRILDAWLLRGAAP
jgi:penicillin-binding protein 2